jgi:NADH-quinone oxidoreductase subunit F
MTLAELESLRIQNIERILPSVPMFLVGMSTCGIGNGAESVYRSLENEIAFRHLNFKLKQTGCFGFCAEEPIVMMYQPQKPLVVYSRVNEKDVPAIIDGMLKSKIWHKKYFVELIFGII